MGIFFNLTVLLLTYYGFRFCGGFGISVWANVCVSETVCVSCAFCWLFFGVVVCLFCPIIIHLFLFNFVFRCLFVFLIRERKKGCGFWRVGSWGRPGRSYRRRNCDLNTLYNVFQYVFNKKEKKSIFIEHMNCIFYIFSELGIESFWLLFCTDSKVGEQLRHCHKDTAVNFSFMCVGIWVKVWPLTLMMGLEHKSSTL